MKYIMVVVGLYLLVTAVKWLITCGLIKLITLCFGLPFSWSIATGIWLVLYLLHSFFKSSGK